MKKIITNDNSPTFYNETFQESYHSSSGAIEEAFKKFVEPCQIAKLAKKDNIYILDICFGLGYNSAAAIETIKSINPNCNIHIIGLENDKSLLTEIQSLNPKLKYYDLIKKLNTIQKNNIHLKLIIGDARETIKQIQLNKFDAVFLDPFSPKKCPELWTESFFKDIKKIMKPDAIMATYSCARIVRDNLKSAGFQIKDGPTVGRRSPGTIALIV